MTSLPRPKAKPADAEDKMVKGGGVIRDKRGGLRARRQLRQASSNVEAGYSVCPVTRPADSRGDDEEPWLSPDNDELFGELGE